ncbi:MAG: hypothetical protein JWR69_2491, partial [Pedosphaera sp.]|nr:hypothetical protein [Pedosphaera sp.]
MNRSILIVICDFLLLSLLMFSTADLNKIPTAAGERTPATLSPAQTNQTSGRDDLGGVMKLALEEERKNRDALLGELARTRDTAGKQQELLNERSAQVQTFQQQLQAREQESQGLQAQQAKLQQQFAVAQTNIQTLNQQLQSNTVEGLLSKEKLAAMEAEARKQAEQAAAMQQQLNLLAKSNQMVLNEKQQLAGQLQVAEVEKRSAVEQFALMKDAVQVERAEKAKLAEGVKTLAAKSSELAKQIEENRPLAPNTIFNDFVTNRVTARFDGRGPGAFGIESNRRRETQTVLITNGTNTFALCHVQDTPLTLWSPGTDWDQLTGTFGRNAAAIPIRSLSFSQVDPRVVLMSGPAAEARSLGCKIYPISSDPFKFQDAVLVGAREGYYGECKFQI